MSHQDPYVSTETLRQLCQPTSATRQTKNSREDAALDEELDALRAARAEAIRAARAEADTELEAELATIRAEARRVGRLLNRIPFFSLVWFFVRIGFAVFFASLLYVLCWWLITAATVGGSASLFLLLSGFLPGQGY